MTYYMGEGSDWNFETDGIPFDICELEHTEADPEENVQEEYVLGVEKAPATGEAPVVGICGTIAMILIVIIAIGMNRLRGVNKWAGKGTC